MAQRFQYQLVSFDGLSEVEDPNQVSTFEFTEMQNLLNLSLEDKPYPYTLFRRAPRTFNLGPRIENRYCLGLFQYLPVGNDLTAGATFPVTFPVSFDKSYFNEQQYIIAVLTDLNRTLVEYKVYDKKADVWIDITPEDNTFDGRALNVSSAFYKRDVFVAMGAQIYKWNGSLSSKFVKLKDKGKAGINLTGTLSFTSGLTVVDGSGTQFTTEVSAGDFIRIQSTGTSADYVEVKEVTSDVELILVNPWPFATQSGGSDDSQKSADADLFKGLFITTHRDRLIMWGGGDSGSNIKTSIPLDPNNQSEFGIFEIEVNEGDGESATGIATKNEFLILFKRTKYYVYKHNPNSASVPYSFVREFPYGCISNNTIEEIGDSVIYFTGKEVRRSNGLSDEVLNNRLTKKFTRYFKGQNSSSYFFQGTNADMGYPSSSVDENRSLYTLCLGSNVDNPGDHVFFFDYRTGKCLGSYYDTNRFSHLTTVIREEENYIIGAPSNTDNFELKRFDFERVDTGGAGIFIRKEDLKIGPVNKKKRIYYVELEAWADSVETEFSLTGIYDFVLDANSVKRQSISQTETGRIKLRFILTNKECYRFGFELLENNTFSSQLGITSITVSYEVLDTP
jgi:hypothetical protein